jgi:hypothetical protein
MKAAVGPVRNSLNMSMLYGIEVDVVDMAREISVIADRVLPIATLPDAFFSLRRLALRARDGLKPPGKTAFYQAPSNGKIRIMLRQSPECVEMIGQNANRNRAKWTTFLNSTVGPPQPIDFFDQQIARSVGKNDQKKKTPPLMFARR